jgi:hypothetical protein
MDAGHPIGDGDRWQAREQVLDERAATSPSRAAGAVDAVQQLAHRDDADRAILDTEEPLDLDGANTALGTPEPHQTAGSQLLSGSVKDSVLSSITETKTNKEHR